MYQIKNVSTITGLNTETLRAWERRYAAVVPSRDIKGRRVYSDDDVKRLILLNNAIAKGHSIGKVASLNNDELRQLISDDHAGEFFDKDFFGVQLIGALKAYEIEKCERLLRHALVGLDPIMYARDVLSPLLRKIGELWFEGEITVAQEHLFSNCVKRITLNLVHNLMTSAESNKKIIFTTLPGEKHEFGILMACMIAASQRFTCYYLGAELPGEELLKAQQNLHAQIIVLGMVNFPTDKRLTDELSTLCNRLPKHVHVCLGGVGASGLTLEPRLSERLCIINEIDEFLATIRMLSVAT